MRHVATILSDAFPVSAKQQTTMDRFRTARIRAERLSLDHLAEL